MGLQGDPEDKEALFFFFFTAEEATSIRSLRGACAITDGGLNL